MFVNGDAAARESSRISFCPLLVGRVPLPPLRWGRVVLAACRRALPLVGEPWPMRPAPSEQSAAAPRRRRRGMSWGWDVFICCWGLGLKKGVASVCEAAPDGVGCGGVLLLVGECHLLAHCVGK